MIKGKEGGQSMLLKYLNILAIDLRLYYLRTQSNLDINHFKDIVDILCITFQELNPKFDSGKFFNDIFKPPEY